MCEVTNTGLLNCNTELLHAVNSSIILEGKTYLCTNNSTFSSSIDLWHNAVNVGNGVQWVTPADLVERAEEGSLKFGNGTR